MITGASDGIGKEMAILLAACGINLVLVARRRAVLTALSDELTARYLVKTLVIDADFSDPTSAASINTATTQLNVGLMIASAGFGTIGAFLDMPIERELNMLDVNCRAVLEMSAHFGRRFVQQRRGGIILISSLVAWQGVPLSANYAATKAYVQTLGEGLHAELKPLGVNVLVSAPGPIQTGFAARANMQMGSALKPDAVAHETLNALGRMTTVRPGFLTKFLDASLSLLPRSGRIWAMGKVMKGMAKS